MDGEAFERFLEEALDRGALTPQEAADCRRIGGTLEEVGVELSAADVAQRKGYLDAAAAGEIQRALARRRIGKYEVLERLGAGSAGVVWRARDTKLGRVVALKVLARHRDGLTRYHERFLREARIAVTLNNVHIVRGLDYGEADGYCYFAMEFVAGENAAQRLEREGRIDEKEALRIARDVVIALVHVRRFDFVHRDIKPSNLLITPSGHVKVCDFGLAKPSLEEAARMGSDGTTSGTPRYMSPEQIRDSTRLDWRSDCYSLGATLYHMLTGSAPFGGGDGGSIIHKHLTQPPRDPRELVPDLSQGTAAVVLKMLQKDPAERYASLADLADDLESVIDDRPPVHTVTFAPRERPVIEALGERPSYRQPSRRRRSALLTAGVLLAGTLAWAGWKVANPSSAQSAQPVAPRTPDSPPPTAPPPPRLGPDGTIEPSPAVVPPVAEAGVPALAAVERDERAGADIVELIDRYQWIVDQFAGTSSAEKAAVRVKELRVRLDAEAAATLTRRRHEARPLEARGRFGAAIELFETFPSRLSGTRAADEARGEVRRLKETGLAHVTELLALARQEIEARNFADAEQLIAEAEAAEVSATQAAVAGVRANYDHEIEQHAARHAAELAGYVALYGKALRVASRSGPAAARGLVDAEVASETLVTFDSEIEELRRHIDSFERVEQALFRAWDRRAAARETASPGPTGAGPRGVPVTVVDRRLELELANGARVAVDPREIDASQLRLLLGDALESADATDQEALFLYLLGSGNFDGARAQIAVLVELADGVLRAAEVEQAATATWQRVWEAAVVEADALIGAARLARAQDRTVDARRDLDRALDTLPSYAPVHVELGLLYMHLGALDDAEGAFRTALALDGSPPETRLRLAQVLARRDRLREAEDLLREVLADGQLPADLEQEGRTLLAEVVAKHKAGLLRRLWKEARKALRDRKGTARAVQLLTQILDLEPTEKDALFQIGRLYAKSGRPFLGYRALTLFVRDNSDVRRVREARSVLADLERFRAPKREALELLKLARAAQADGRLDDAIESFRSALEVSPFLTEARFRLGEALLVRGARSGASADLAAGEAALADVVLLHPEHWAALREMARARLALGRPKEALGAAERAMEADKNDADAAVLAGRAHFALRDLDVALERFEEASRRDAHAGEPVMRRAIVLERMGRRAQARHLVDRIYADNLRVPVEIAAELDELYQRLQD